MTVSYGFFDVTAGTYTVEVIYPEGYTGTTTSRVSVTVGEASVSAAADLGAKRRQLRRAAAENRFRHRF